MAELELKYWGGRGLMEVPRMMLAIAGKFPGEGYTDGRFTSPEGLTGLETNMGRMPIITTASGDSIGQSVAINFYIASETGLLGSSTLEAAQIIAITEHCKELVDSWRKIVPYGNTPTEENLELFFEGGATDTTGIANMQDRTRYFKWFSGRIEAILGDDGFAVGGKLSLADVMLYNTFAETLQASEKAESVAEWRVEPFSSAARTSAGLASCPKLSACIASVAGNANVQKWLATRGTQYF